MDEQKELKPEESPSIPLEPASSDLIDSIEESTYGDSQDAKLFDIAHESLQKFKEIEQNYTNDLVGRASEALFPSVELREEYYKKIAGQLYREIYKQSKAFLKEWAFLNLCRPRWANPYERYMPLKVISSLSKFMPRAYTLSMYNIDSGESTVIVELMPTPIEATIAAAKKLGFDSSNYRKKALNKFSAQAISVILKDDRYLKEEKYLDIFEEYCKQIRNREVPSHIKDTWLQSLQSKFDQRSDLV